MKLAYIVLLLCFTRAFGFINVLHSILGLSDADATENKPVEEGDESKVKAIEKAAVAKEAGRKADLEKAVVAHKDKALEQATEWIVKNSKSVMTKILSQLAGLFEAKVHEIPLGKTGLKLIVKTDACNLQVKGFGIDSTCKATVHEKLTGKETEAVAESQHKAICVALDNMLTELIKLGQLDMEKPKLKHERVVRELRLLRRLLE